MKIEFTEAMLNKMNFEPLFDYISTVTGISREELQMKAEYTKRNDRGRIRINSSNLSHKAGCFSTADLYERLEVSTFNSEFAYDKDEDIYYYWMTIHFAWEYNHGGSNGCELFTAWYYFKNREWKFKKGR